MASCRNDVPVILCVSSFAEGCFAVTVLWGSGFEVFVCCERALLVEVLGVAVLSKQVFIIFLYVCAVQAKRTPKIIKMIPSIPEEIVNNPTSIKDNAMMVQVLWIDFAFFLVRFSFLTISSYCALLSVAGLAEELFCWVFFGTVFFAELFFGELLPILLV